MPTHFPFTGLTCGVPSFCFSLFAHFSASHPSLPMQRRIVSFLLFCAARLAMCCAAMSSCTVPSDCSSRGVCTAGACSCYSGFSSANCSARPHPSCSFNNVFVLSASFQVISSLRYVYPHLNVTVAANLETSPLSFPSTNDSASALPYSLDTVIFFGNSSAFSACSYPGPLWSVTSATSGDCRDVFSAVMRWQSALTLCGFTDTAGDWQYQQTLTVRRQYLLGVQDSQNITRTEEITNVLSVVFPTSVDIGTPAFAH